MKKIPDIQLQLIMITIGFAVNFLMGITGSIFPSESFWQITIWQIGDAAAIMACVLSSRFVGTKGLHVVPAGFIMLGIAFGVSLAASSFDSINTEKLATIVLPLFPALLLISIGKYFPTWVRITSALICIPFFMIYYSVINNTYSIHDWPNAVAYIGLQLLGPVWSLYFWKDHRATQKAKG